MKTRNILFFVIILVSIFLLAACSSTDGTQQPSESATNAPGEQSSSTSSTTDGLALIQEKLANHHGLDVILSAKKNREEWNATLDRMNSYGANISDAEKQVIIDYLLNR